MYKNIKKNKANAPWSLKNGIVFFFPISLNEQVIKATQKDLFSNKCIQVYFLFVKTLLKAFFYN